MKICSKCKIDKDFSEFSLRKDSKDGFRNECKNCLKLQRKDYFDNYRKENVEEINKKIKDYYFKNPEKRKDKTKKWLDKNTSYFKKYQKDRRKNDNLFKLISNIRTLIGQKIRNGGYTKKSKTNQILGCSYEGFKSHIESKFETWMNWNNYGKYNGEFNYGWDIDHIIPVGNAETEEEIIKLNHYTNLQPLCSKVNRDIKKDKLEYVSNI